MYPTSHGWELDQQGILLPRTVPIGTLSAHGGIPKLVHYKCKTSGCLTAGCSCTNVGCTVFCLCASGEACKNPLTRNQSDEESVEPDEDTDEYYAQIMLWLLVVCNIYVNKVICWNEWNFNFNFHIRSPYLAGNFGRFSRHIGSIW